MGLKVLYDLQCALSSSNLGGIGRYSLDLLKALLVEDKGNEYFVLLNDSNASAENQVREELRQLLPFDRFIAAKFDSNGAFNRNDYVAQRLNELVYCDLVEKIRPDILHISSVVEGYSDQVYSSILDRSKRDYLVSATMYDLIPLEHSEIYLRDQPTRAHYLERVGLFPKADFLLSISDFTTRETRRLMPSFRGNIYTIHGGVDEKFSRNLSNERLREAVLTVGLRGQYYLYTASFDRRKNQQALIEAYARLSAKIRRDYKLVIVGNGWDSVYRDLHDVAQRNGVPRSSVVFTGRVDDATLVALYQQASCFVFPSLYEGLGLPVLEAQAAGVPVIASNTTSVPELLASREYTFDPTDIRAIAELMERAVTDHAFVENMLRENSEYVKKFTWARSARLAGEAFAREALLGTARATAADGAATNVDLLQREKEQIRRLVKAVPGYDVKAAPLARFVWNDLASGLSAGRARIGWVTTWGGRCGIATYSQEILSSASYEHHVFAARLTSGDGPAESNVTRCWSQDRLDRLDDLHFAIKLYDPDAVVIQLNYGFFDAAALCRFVIRLRASGIAVIMTLHSTIDPPEHILPVKLSDFWSALVCCEAVYVHNHQDVQRLLRLGLSNIQLFPHPIPHVVALTVDSAERFAGIQDQLIPSKRWISSYGFFLPHKGLLETIEAIALLRERQLDVGLLMLNASYGDPGGISEGEISRARARIEELSLGGSVILISDFMSNEETLRLLASVEAVVYAYQVTGESASGAVRMALAAEKPLIVTPLSIFDDVAQFAHVLEGTEPEAIAAGIEAALFTDAGLQRSAEISTAIPELKNRLHPRIHDSLIVRSVQSAQVSAYINGPARSDWDLVSNNAPVQFPVSSERKAGVFLYGPYVRIEKGVYRFRAAGRAGPWNGAPAGRLIVTAAGGALTMAEFPLRQRPGGAVVDDILIVTSDVDQAEFVFEALREDVDITIDNYQLVPLHH